MCESRPQRWLKSEIGAVPGMLAPLSDSENVGNERVSLMSETKQLLARLWFDETGISSVEYALLLAFIAAGVAIAADQLGGAVETEINGTADCINSSPPDPTLCN